MTVGTSFIQQQPDEPGTRISLRSEAGRTSDGCWRQRQQEFGRAANSRERQSTEGLPWVVWPLLSGQLISQSSSKFEQKHRARKWDFLCLALPGAVGIFYRKVPSFLGKYFMGCF